MTFHQTKLALYALGSVLAVVSSTVVAENSHSKIFFKPSNKQVFFWSRDGTMQCGQCFIRQPKAPECCLTTGF